MERGDLVFKFLDWAVNGNEGGGVEFDSKEMVFLRLAKRREPFDGATLDETNLDWEATKTPGGSHLRPFFTRGGFPRCQGCGYVA